MLRSARRVPSELSRPRPARVSCRLLFVFAALVSTLAPSWSWAAAALDLAGATIVVRSGTLPRAEETAARVLREEVEGRTGLTWAVSTSWPTRGPVVVLTSPEGDPGWSHRPPRRDVADPPERRPEGYRLVVQAGGPHDGIVWIVGGDSRGVLFGAGRFLRTLTWRKGAAELPTDLDIATAPVYPIRGHQLGYRHHSNTYDGWDDRQYEQYIRELALFGANSIENIPFQDTRPAPLMPLPRDVMNRRISEICARYEMDYWLWTPADFDLSDRERRAQALSDLEALFQDLPRLDAVFFPGGDPGDNPAQLVMPYLEDVADRLRRHHPQARVWLSLQHFDAGEIDFVYARINGKPISWFGGLVAGPGSPPLATTRARLDPRYPLRDYPDITHTVRAQYPVPWWDPAFAFTLGREPINPRPVFYAAVHARLGPYTDGFITYSDGVNDDVNKAIWSLRGWDPDMDVRDMLREYTRTFFGSSVAEDAADGILALERNWEGSLALNGGVDATRVLWQSLERRAPALRDNWRWQMKLLRAYYDAYTRHRLFYETALEKEAMAVLARAPGTGAAAAIDAALAVLRRADHPCCPEWRRRIEELCDALFASIRMQTSVPRHQASGTERGAVLDLVDYPLNNRWWLADEFERIRSFSTEAGRLARLEVIRTWENPGPGSFYDDVGNVGKSPRVLRGDGTAVEALERRSPNPHFQWWDSGYSRTRPAWQSSLRWPLGLQYHHLDPAGSYMVRLTAQGEVRLRINGESVEPTIDSRELGEFREYPVPAHLLREGRLLLTFDPIDERHLNWRQHSRLNEVWLLKR
jgi:hypothetical protein